MKSLFYLIVLIAIGAFCFIHFTNKKEPIQKPKGLYEHCTIMESDNNQVLGFLTKFNDGDFFVTNQNFLEEISKKGRSFVNSKGEEFELETKEVEVSESLDIARLKFKAKSPEFKLQTYKIAGSRPKLGSRYTIFGNDYKHKFVNSEEGAVVAIGNSKVTLTNRHNIRVNGAIIINSDNELLGIGSSEIPSLYLLAPFYTDSYNQKLLQIQNYRGKLNCCIAINNNMKWVKKSGTSIALKLSKLKEWSAMAALYKELYSYTEYNINQFYKDRLVKFLSTGIRNSPKKKSFFNKLYKNYTNLCIKSGNFYERSPAELTEIRSKIIESIKYQKKALSILMKQVKGGPTSEQFLDNQNKILAKFVLDLKDDFSKVTDRAKQKVTKIDREIARQNQNSLANKEGTLHRLKIDLKSAEARLKYLRGKINYYKPFYTKAVNARDKAQAKKFEKTPSSDMVRYANYLKDYEREKKEALKRISNLKSQIANL